MSAQNRQRLYWTNIPNIQQPLDKGIMLQDILETEVDEKLKLNDKQRKGTLFNCKLLMVRLLGTA